MRSADGDDAVGDGRVERRAPHGGDELGEGGKTGAIVDREAAARQAAAHDGLDVGDRRIDAGRRQRRRARRGRAARRGLTRRLMRRRSSLRRRSRWRSPRRLPQRSPRRWRRRCSRTARAAPRPACRRSPRWRTRDRAWTGAGERRRGPHGHAIRSRRAPRAPRRRGLERAGRQWVRAQLTSFERVATGHPSIASAAAPAPLVGYNPPMKIAQIAPPWITVPPAGYGGTEWVVKHLCDGLTAAGHEVVLFASGDSQHAGRAARPVRRAADGDDGAALGDDLLRRPPRVVRARADPGRRRLRRGPRPLGLPARRLSPLPRSAARAAHRALRLRHARLPVLPAVPRRRRLRLDQRLPAHAGAARHELGRHRPQRPAGRRLAVRRPPRTTTCWPSGASARTRASTSPSTSPGAPAIASSWPASCRTGIATTSRQRIAPEIDGDRVVFEDEVTDERKRELFAARQGLSLPDPVARAVRPGDGRGHGDRHAGDRAAQRLGRRGRRRRRDRLRLRRRRPDGGRRGAARRDRPRTPAGARSRSASAWPP